ncbi:hypothetical protein CEXT_476641 [Caerostris extrusa]|uniref:Uncharacterized protein n=1 Tax=Caerostris extrusa TaxID=172846 RepID=A0AAV4VL40_CAEEX|nr:hypothetical protein CEXT_476641 [Caerostris extrusa]
MYWELDRSPLTHIGPGPWGFGCCCCCDPVYKVTKRSWPRFCVVSKVESSFVQWDKDYETYQYGPPPKYDGSKFLYLQHVPKYA